MTTKKCNSCNTEKMLQEFLKNRNFCKKCRKFHREAYYKAYDAGDKDKIKAYNEVYNEVIKSYNKVHNEIIKANHKANCETLSDSYVKLLLRIPNAPKELIELKRVQMQIKRFVKNKN